MHVVLININLFCVFTVMPSKIKMQTSQYKKSRIWEMKEDKYTKSLAKNQKESEKRFTQIYNALYGDAILVSLSGAHYGRRKQTETSVFEFSYLCANSSLEELIKI